MITALAPTRIRLGLLGVSVLALAFAGCGGSTTTVDRTVTVTTQGTTTSATTQPTTSTSTTEKEPAPSEPPTRFVHLTSFRSPSGNIGCMLVGGVARCDIFKRDWSPPPRPASCPHIVDYGQGLELGRSGAARVVCAGDTARDPSAPSLPYETASQAGPFICVSRPVGMTCTNRTNGHGFFISIQSYRLF